MLANVCVYIFLGILQMLNLKKNVLFIFVSFDLQIAMKRVERRRWKAEVELCTLKSFLQSTSLRQK